MQVRSPCHKTFTTNQICMYLKLVQDHSDTKASIKRQQRCCYLVLHTVHEHCWPVYALSRVWPCCWGHQFHPRRRYLKNYLKQLYFQEGLRSSSKNRDIRIRATVERNIYSKPLFAAVTKVKHLQQSTLKIQCNAKSILTISLNVCCFWLEVRSLNLVVLCFLLNWMVLCRYLGVLYVFLKGKRQKERFDTQNLTI